MRSSVFGKPGGHTQARRQLPSEPVVLLVGQTDVPRSHVDGLLRVLVRVPGEDVAVEVRHEVAVDTVVDLTGSKTWRTAAATSRTSDQNPWSSVGVMSKSSVRWPLRITTVQPCMYWLKGSRA